MFAAIDAHAIDPPLDLGIVASFDVVGVVDGGGAAVDFGLGSVFPFAEFEGLAVAEGSARI